MEAINEGQTSLIEVTFRDENNQLVIPTTAFYSIYCETQKQVVLAETQIQNPTSVTEIVITGAQNAILNKDNPWEDRLITVRWTWGASRDGVLEFRYRVLNFKQIGSVWTSDIWPTVEAYKQWAAIKGTEKDTSIKTMIPLSQSIIESYCNRVFSKAAKTEYYNGSKRKVFVKCPPIDPVITVQMWDDTNRVYDGATLVPATDYAIDYESGIIQLEYPTFQGLNSLKVSYTGGYSILPNEILSACYMLIAVLMKEGPGGTIGISSRSMPNGSVAFVSEDLPATLRMILDKFRLPPIDL